MSVLCFNGQWELPRQRGWARLFHPPCLGWGESLRLFQERGAWAIGGGDQIDWDFPVSDEMQEMILLMPHACLCLWSSLRRRRPNRDVQNTGDTGSCSHGGEWTQLRRAQSSACSQRTLPDIELITLKWAHVKSKILQHETGGKRVRSMPQWSLDRPLMVLKMEGDPHTRNVDNL